MLVMVPLSFAAFYFPLRLYFAGKVQHDKIVHIIQIRSSVPLPQYHIRCLNSKKVFELSDTSGFKEKQDVLVLVHKTVTQGICLKSSRPTLRYVLTHYNSTSDNFSVFGTLMFLLVMMCTAFYYLKKIITNNIKDTKSKFATDDTGIEKAAAYVKALLPIISLLSFSYVMAVFLIKVVLSVEDQSDWVAGFIIAYSLMLVIFSPAIVNSIAKTIKTSKNKRVRNVKVIVATMISVYLAGMGIYFLLTKNLSDYTNLKKVMADFLKFIFPL